MASKRRIRRNACTGKKRYEAKADALSTALHMKRSGKTGGYVNAYKCKFCGGFHWGHS